MPDSSTRASTRLQPTNAWTVVTDAPLLGFSLAREAGAILAWDDGGRVYLLDLNGERVLESKAGGKVSAGSISDDGSLIGLLVDGARLLFLDQRLEPISERPAPSEATGVAIDPHGRYIAIASKLPHTQLFTRFGKPAGTIETRTPMAHLRFVPGLPIIVGAAAFGGIAAIELEPAAKSALKSTVLWEERITSNVGRLATTGDGGVILASCFTHGVQRYDFQGHNEGSYHLGGTVTHASVDFPGRTIAIATQEGDLCILNSAGNVRWKGQLPRPALGLEIDALGRFLIHGQSSGEITRVDLEGAAPSAGSASKRKTDFSKPGTIRPPDWSIPLADSDEQAETAVLAICEEPPRVCVLMKPNKLRVFGIDGGALGEAPGVQGVGRIIRTSPGWIASATDRQVALYDAQRNTSKRLDVSLNELTHLAIRPDSYGLATIQERDRLGRVTVAGQWVWRKELRTPVEDMAIGPKSLMAVTTEDGQLLVLDAAGETHGQFSVDPPEPMLLIEAPEFAPDNVAWVTLARRQQILRGHRADAKVLWESPVPWEAWQLHRAGSLAIVVAPDARTIAFDGSGHLEAQCRLDTAQALFFPSPKGATWYVAKSAMNLICNDLDGNVVWRSVAEETIGPIAAGTPGVAAMLGRSLAWFGSR